jgi:hypothetical protein
VNKLGKVNMLSNRNVDSKSDYVALRNYMGMSEKEIKQTKSTSIEDAIDVTVKNTPGGEFLKNVKMYQVIRDQKYYYAVEGDVWGLPENANYRGFKVGDRVQWSTMLSKKTGIITNLMDSNQCTIKVESSGNIENVDYDKLLKIE